MALSKKAKLDALEKIMRKDGIILDIDIEKLKELNIKIRHITPFPSFYRYDNLLSDIE